MPTNVYVDAFNLYYGCLKGTPYKWLDLETLCAILLPNNDIQQIKYFTARISARPHDPHQPARQQVYLRALATLPKVSIIYGQYLSHPVTMPLANPVPGGPRFATVLKTEEKGSDVNIATHLIHDACLNYFDTAAIITNDSDLLEPLRIANQEMGKIVGILNPHQHPSFQLRNNAQFFKQIRTSALARSQFPQIMTDTNGVFHKPATW
jgi:NYN domain